MRLSVLLAVMVSLAGCQAGNGVNAWEGVSGQDINGDGYVAGAPVGSSGPDSQIAYPDGVDRVYDIAVDGDTLWLWAENFSDAIDGPVLIPVSRTTGDAGTTVVIQQRPARLTSSSAVTRGDGVFWFTSFGDAAQAELYRVSADGTVDKTLTCPFAPGGNQCAGVAWDGNYLWTGQDGGTQVARMDPASGDVVGSPFSPWGGSSNTTALDFLFAQTSLDGAWALAVRNGHLYQVFSRTEQASDQGAVGFDRAGANADLIWYPSDADKVIYHRATP